MTKEGGGAKHIPAAVAFPVRIFTWLSSSAMRCLAAAASAAAKCACGLEEMSAPQFGQEIEDEPSVVEMGTVVSVRVVDICWVF